MAVVHNELGLPGCCQYSLCSLLNHVALGVELNSYDISVGVPMSLVCLLQEEGAECHLKLFQALHVCNNVAGQSNQLRNI